MKICKGSTDTSKPEFPDVEAGDVIKMTGVVSPMKGYYLVAKSPTVRDELMLVSLENGAIWNDRSLWGTLLKPESVKKVDACLTVK